MLHDYMPQLAVFYVALQQLSCDCHIECWSVVLIHVCADVSGDVHVNSDLIMTLCISCLPSALYIWHP